MTDTTYAVSPTVNPHVGSTRMWEFMPDSAERSWYAMKVQSVTASSSALACASALLTTLLGASVPATAITLNGSIVPRSVLDVDLPRVSNAQAAIDLLNLWLSDDSNYDIETWPAIKKSLEQNRLSNRKLFNG